MDTHHTTLCVKHKIELLTGTRRSKAATRTTTQISEFNLQCGLHRHTSSRK